MIVLALATVHMQNREREPAVGLSNGGKEEYFGRQNLPEPLLQWLCNYQGYGYL